MVFVQPLYRESAGNTAYRYAVCGEYNASGGSTTATAKEDRRGSLTAHTARRGVYFTHEQRLSSLFIIIIYLLHALN